MNEILNNPEAEKAVIGSVVIDGQIYKDIDYLSPDDFSCPENQTVWKAVQSLYRAGSAIDQVTIGHELDKHHSWEMVDCGYLLSCTQSVVTSYDAPHYAKIVKELSMHRRAIQYAQSGDYENLSKLLKEQPTSAKVITSNDIADAMISLSEDNPYRPIPYRWEALDSVTTGMNQSEMTIIGARPSVGKSEIMLEQWLHSLKCGYSAMYVSAEMSLQMVIERITAIEASIDVRKLRTRTLTNDEWGRVADVAGRVAEYSAHLVASDVSVSDISAIARRASRDKLDIVLVDYLQFLRDCYDDKKGGNLVQRVGYISRSLKALAVELNVPVIVASQLSRSVESRENKRPILSDLRESGNIEQDADVILLLHRPEHYAKIDSMGRSTAGILEIAHAKNRQIDSGQVIQLQWGKNLFRYI